MLLDGDNDFCQHLQECLAKLDLPLIPAHNADEARMRMQFQEFDLIILDINLRGQNGLQFLQALRQNAPKRWPKVILITTTEFSDEAKTKMMNLMGINCVLQKPISDNDLINVVQSTLIQQKEKTKADYDVGIMNAFLTATIKMIESNSGQTPERETPFVKSEALTYGEFSGIIHFTGKKARGVIAISFEHACIEALAKALFQGAEVEMNDALLSDVAGELCNQLAGQAQAIFEQEGTRFEISTPTLVQGKQHNIVHKFQSPCLILPFHFAGSRFFTEFILEKIGESTKNTGAAVSPKEIPVEDSDKKETRLAESGEITFF